MKKIILLLSLLTIPSLCYGQPNTPCSTSSYNPVVSNAAGTSLYICTTGGTWLALPVTPPGSIVMLTSGTCNAGWVEATELDGVTLVGTLASHSNVGTTGGADNVTPTGTNSALTFTGNSITSSAVSAGTPAGTNSATATSGNCAATNLAIGTGATTACKATAPNLTVPAETFSGSALATHTHTTTATGTINTPSFSGVQFDNRSSFTRVIFCKKS